MAVRFRTEVVYFYAVTCIFMEKTGINYLFETPAPVTPVHFGYRFRSSVRSRSRFGSRYRSRVGSKFGSLVVRWGGRWGGTAGRWGVEVTVQLY